MKFPIDEILPALKIALAQYASVIITAPPGAGKSTQVPAFLIREELLRGQALLFEPRRLSVKTLANHIAENLKVAIGDTVGYQIRFENRTGPKTRIKIITEGLFSKILLSNPYLEGIDVVIIDEFHERSLPADLAVAQIHELQSTVRPDLKLIIMSATLDPAPLLKFLPNSVHLHSEGRMFPVEEVYYDRPVPLRNEEALVQASRDTLKRLLANELASGAKEKRDILMFLPGAPEINRFEPALADIANEHAIKIYPLHGQLKLAEQERALLPQTQRKLILATNLAETSLTVQNLGYVIDAGLVKTARIDYEFGVDKLELERISQFSAEQRAGRAGRLGPGTVFRLWTRNEHNQLKRQGDSEIHRVDLSSSLLQLIANGTDPETFNWYEKPRAENQAAALAKLMTLGAITSDRKITEAGLRMLDFPLEPRLARLMTLAKNPVETSFAAFVAALLNEGDFLSIDRFTKARHHDESDVRRRIDAFLGRDTGYQVQRKKVEVIDEVFRRLGGKSADLGEWLPRFDEILLVAFAERLCRLRDSTGSGTNKTDAVMVGNRGVKLFDSSEAQGAPFFLALDARQLPASQARILGVSLAHPVEAGQLAQAASHLVSRRRTVFHDEGLGKLRALQQKFFLDLPLDEGHPESPTESEIRAHLRTRYGSELERTLRADPSTRMLALRFEILQKYVPELLDDYGFTEWQKDFSDFVENAVVSGPEAQAVDELLVQALPYRLQKILSDEAPVKVEVPTGNRYALEYRDQMPPKIAVRLQEIFGWQESPRIARGRVAVVLELLSPGYKPVQTTEDLKSFWAKAYFEVRKELRARYPKHSWPDNPLEATPVAKGRPRLKS